ncbi:hypothetical protein SAMN05216275_14184 [Streptosporangium canum]|uniref:Uncharacterized protein n=1 Tax=Streptosporangium canum TaxID=324952 RepID=A0A1I4DJP5_9ACTN|nr:hypothetical protein [Streptosporangium canum]SFK92970.1 hypothetical protein SAMN05216275_14184 [Streptosporangium canum]
MNDSIDGLVPALARLDRDAARARLTLAAGGTQEDAEAVMSGDLRTDSPDNLRGA